MHQVRKDSVSEKVSKAEGPPLNGNFISLEQNACMKKNPEGMVSIAQLSVLGAFIWNFGNRLELSN